MFFWVFGRFYIFCFVNLFMSKEEKEKEVLEEDEEGSEGEVEEDEEDLELIVEDVDYFDDSLSQFLANPWKTVSLAETTIAPVENLEVDLPRREFKEDDEEENKINYLTKIEDGMDYVKPEQLQGSVDELYRTGMNEGENLSIEEQKKSHSSMVGQSEAFSKSFEMSQAMKNSPGDLYVKAEDAKDAHLRKNIKDINESYKVR